MNLIFIFLAASVLFSATAIPMQAPQPQTVGSSSASNPSNVPKVDFRMDHRVMSSNDRAAAHGVITNHYKGLEPGNEQKKARLAVVHHEWKDGIWPGDEHRQYLNFDYHQGGHQDGAKIGQTVVIARNRPPPESHFAHSVPKESKPDMASEMNKKYRNLPPDQAKRVRSMRANGDWSEGDGFREETQMTFHHNTKPTPYNIVGNPATIYRPMSFLIDDAVPKKEAPVIKKRIRQEHEDLDANHPFKQANYAVVMRGWHKPEPGKPLHVGTTFFKMKDELSGNPEEDYERIGHHYVPLGQGRSPVA